MTALTVRRLPNLATPEELWSGTWESDPVALRSERSGMPFSSLPKLENHFCPPIRIRTGISTFGGLGPAPLDHGPESIWGGRRKLNPRGRFHRPPPNHSATATLGARTSRLCDGLARLVEEEGIEPPSAGCRPAVLPLNDSPNFFGARGGSRNPNLRFTRAALVRLSYSGAYINFMCGADAENRTLFVGLAVRCPTNRRHPRKLWSGRR